MAQTYCVKCRAKTNSVSERLETTESGRKKLIGKCVVCGTNKHTFVSKDGSIKLKTPAEEAIAKEKKERAKENNKKALKLAKKIMAENSFINSSELGSSQKLKESSKSASE
ncbi:5941_t:CDS:2 [Entrophospora sp. SA101]|nr:5941_t:CDS:2 [Entrophospora sp. SA101]CAJ0842192.1 19398_t:CDS:2 [Entrophospora sp. SA101]CAJ0844348.1 14634_t:CDS:2 [Entrophospora sp. SA101]